MSFVLQISSRLSTKGIFGDEMTADNFVFTEDVGFFVVWSLEIFVDVRIHHVFMDLDY